MKNRIIKKIIFICLLILITFGICYVVLDRYYSSLDLDNKVEEPKKDNTDSNFDLDSLKNEYSNTKTSLKIVNEQEHSLLLETIATLNEDNIETDIKKYNINVKLLIDENEIDNLIEEYSVSTKEDLDNLLELINAEINVNIIKGVDNKEYLVFKEHKYNQFKKNDRILVFNELGTTLSILEIDAMSNIGSLEGENSSLYGNENDGYKFYAIEEDKIRYLVGETCSKEDEVVEKLNFTEVILNINNDKAITENRNTHVGSNFSGSSICEEKVKVTIY